MNQVYVYYLILIRGIHLDQWFSTWDMFALQETFGNVWKHFLVVTAE